METNKKIRSIKSDTSRNEPYFSKLNRKKTDDRKPQDLIRSLPQLARDIKSKINLNDKMLELFPDIELCTQILTSSILSSNDMVTTSLVYNTPDIRLPGTINNSIKDTIEDHIETNYKLSSSLTKYLKESLVTKGAYVEVIIPEAAVDELINAKYDTDGNIVSIESYKAKLETKKDDLSLGIFNISKTNNVINVGNESYVVSNRNLGLNEQVVKTEKQKVITPKDLHIDITDSLSVIISNEVIKDMSSTVNKKSLSKFQGRVNSTLSLEDNSKLNDVFKNSESKTRTDLISVKTIRELKVKSFGKPLVFTCPVESIIPVYVANNVNKHLGYFLLLDEQGNPLNIDQDELVNDQSMYHTNRQTSDNNSNSLLTKALLGMDSMGTKDYKNKDLKTAFTKILDNMLETKLKNSVYTEVAKLNLDSALYSVMLSRALEGRQTKFLFLPAELVQYYAFEYRSNGTGKSMLEKQQMLFSIRSLLLMSRVSGNIRSSMPVTKVTATLDDDDVNPEKTMEEIYSSSLTARQSRLPIGLIDATDITSWLHQSGFVYNFKHPSLPNMELDVTDENRSVAEPNSDLEDKITQRIYMGMSLTPEIVQAGYNSDFATTVVAKNLLMAKRIGEYQKTLNPQISRHVKLYLSNDITLQNKVVNIITMNMKSIKENMATYLESSELEETEVVKYKEVFSDDDKIINYILNKYIEDITVNVPVAELTEANAMKTAFDQYKGTLDEYIDIIIPEEVYTAALGEKVGSSENITKLKGLLKATLLRKWMNDNNYITELSDIVSVDEDGNPRLNMLADFNSMLKPLGKAIISLLKDDSEIKKDLEKLYDDAGIVQEESGDDYGGDNSYGGDAASSDGMGDSTGGDADTNGGDDFGMGDETPSDGDNVDDGGSDKESEIKDDAEDFGDEEEPKELNLFADDEDEPSDDNVDKEDKDKESEDTTTPKKEEKADNDTESKVDKKDKPDDTKDDKSKKEEVDKKPNEEDVDSKEEDKKTESKDENGLEDDKDTESDEDKKKKNNYLKSHEIKH